MALRFIEGWDTLAQGDLISSGKWQAWSHGINAAGYTTGRSGNAWQQTYGDRTLDKSIDAQGTWIIGFAMTVSINSGYSLVMLQDGLGGTSQVELRFNGSNQLYVTRNGTTIVGPSTSQVLNPASLWHYYEIRAVISDSVGEIEVRVDGVTYLTGTGLDTKATGNATADTIRFGDRGSFGGSQIIDDVYMCDGTGATNNTFLGDLKVQGRFPDGNGNSSQLVGNDGNSTDNYLLVDESTPNSDTDYVESSTVGNKDTYTYQNLTNTTGTVFGVQILPFAKKTDAGTRKIVSIARLSGTEVDSADRVLLSSYAYFPDVRETKPGGGAWSVTDVNNAEFGVKVTA